MSDDGEVTLAPAAGPEFAGRFDSDVRIGRRDTGYVSDMLLTTPMDYERRRGTHFGKEDSSGEDGELPAEDSVGTWQLGRGDRWGPVTDGQQLPVLDGSVPGTLGRAVDVGRTPISDGPRPVLHGLMPSVRRSVSGGSYQSALEEELRRKDDTIRLLATEMGKLRNVVMNESAPLTIAPVNAPVTAPVAPVIAPVAAPVAPVIAPVAPVIAPVGAGTTVHDLSDTNGRRKSTLPTVKLGQFDGSSPLETFLAKFENCSDYYNWDDRERLCHLRASLDSEAGQVLWDAGTQTSTENVIDLLKNRFGNQNQCERYRAELKTIRRQKGSSLQTVYNEVRRLMALAFPGQRGIMWEVMARDAFLDALEDRAMRLRIMERDPPTLDQALNIACHFEAIARPSMDTSWDDRGHKRDRLVRGATAEDDGRKQLDQRLRHMECALKTTKDEVDQYRSENAWLRQSAAPQS